MQTFATLKESLERIPDQQTGRASAVCEIGEPYIEFCVGGLARPDDVAVVENHVAEQMGIMLAQYLTSRKGRIYWRVPLEWQTAPHAVVMHLDPVGPDTDFLTGQRCVMDHNWRKIAGYCRLVRAQLPAEIAA